MLSFSIHHDSIVGSFLEEEKKQRANKKQQARREARRQAQQSIPTTSLIPPPHLLHVNRPPSLSENLWNNNPPSNPSPQAGGGPLRPILAPTLAHFPQVPPQAHSQVQDPTVGPTSRFHPSRARDDWRVPNHVSTSLCNVGLSCFLSSDSYSLSRLRRGSSVAFSSSLRIHRTAFIKKTRSKRWCIASVKYGLLMVRIGVSTGNAYLHLPGSYYRTMKTTKLERKNKRTDMGKMLE